MFPFAQYNFANILIYIPVGILTCACFIRDTDQQEKTGVKHWVREDKATIFTINSWILLLVATLLGLIVSSIVETLQLYLCKGTFEIDDLLNNAVGAFIGASWVVKKADYSTSKILEFINFIWIICFLVLFIRAGYLQAVHR